MDPTTYFRHPDDPALVYVTRDRRQRRHLDRRGWRRTDRRDLDRAFGDTAVAILAVGRPGRFRWGADGHFGWESDDVSADAVPRDGARRPPLTTRGRDSAGTGPHR